MHRPGPVPPYGPATGPRQGPPAAAGGRALATLRRLFRPGRWVQDLQRYAPGTETPVNTGRRIVITGLQAGVGASTTTGLLGSTYAIRRRDAILAVDLDGAAPLCGRLARTGPAWGVDLRAALTARRLRSASDFGRFLPRAASGLWLLPPAVIPDDESLSWLLRMVSIGLIDRPPGPLDPGDELLAQAQTVLLVVPDDPGMINSTGQHLQSLAGSPVGAELLSRTLVVINNGRSRRSAGRGLAGLCAGVLELGHDDHLSSGGPISTALLSDDTVIDLTRLAARVLDLSLGSRPEPGVLQGQR